jgi:hypothetical protein
MNDLKKAQWYLDRLVQKVELEEPFPIDEPF